MTLKEVGAGIVMVTFRRGCKVAVRDRNEIGCHGQVGKMVTTGWRSRREPE